jgi:hypothetical protein
LHGVVPIILFLNSRSVQVTLHFANTSLSTDLHSQIAVKISAENV